MTIVLDTNCLIQIMPRRAKHRWLYDALINNKLILAISTEIINEYEETINTFYESESLGRHVTKMILDLPQIKKISPTFRWQLIEADPDDNKYPNCAIAAQADYIITHDKHFNILKQIPFPKVVCVTLDEFEVIFDDFVEGK
ncbi:MAG: putative toxin-antitoxin system toxin component, PIN family [Bacteroidota bacterium]